ncbi:hypothetical protein H4R19_001469 [Coemansia spiralis]|nr:hypothetical protein H4R19_001469 [Coemansia spiralis]
MRPWGHEGDRWREKRGPYLPPLGPQSSPRPRPPSMPNWVPPRRPPLPPPPPPAPELSSEERSVIEKMAETQHSNPELVSMVRQSHRDHPRYRFLFSDSPLHAYFLWRVSQVQCRVGANTAGGLRPLPPGRPPPPPPLHALGPPPEPPTPAPEPMVAAPDPPRRYFELPAGLMVKLVDEGHQEYTPLRTADLESAEFLESVAQGLSAYRDVLEVPGVSEELEQALAAFDEGVRYIHKEGEYEDRNGGSEASKTLAIDREGWGPGVLETVLWRRRQGRAQRRRRQRQGSDVTSDTSSSDSRSSDNESDSDSSSTGGSGSTSSDERDAPRKRDAAAKPTNINRALGSDNMGFKLLSKLGWQKGQGLGVAGDGIVEPIRLQSRFSTVRRGGRAGGARRGRGKGKRVVRPSLGVGGTGDDRVPEVADEDLEQFRKQKSTAFNQVMANHWPRDDVDG